VNCNPGVSLIATVLNERGNIAAWLEGILGQQRLPDELIIVDGGSTDGTWEFLQKSSYPFTVVLRQARGASISEGRNLALSLACGEIIAVTDAGTVADRNWLAHLAQALDDPDIDVASGFFIPHATSAWERSLAAATLPDESDIRWDSFLPSSRSVAVRSSWVRHGFAYPEWLDYCEDLIWDLQLRNAGARFRFVPAAFVKFGVRPTPLAFARQYFLYARGDGKAGLFGKRHLVRYSTYLAFTIVLCRKNPAELVVAGFLGCAYLSRPVRRLIRRCRAEQNSFASNAISLGMIPLQVGLGDAAKMAGYLPGVFWRRKRFGTVHPGKNWRRITPAGEMWNPAALLEEPRQRED